MPQQDQNNEMQLETEGQPSNPTPTPNQEPAAVPPSVSSNVLPIDNSAEIKRLNDIIAAQNSVIQDGTKFQSKVEKQLAEMNERLNAKPAPTPKESAERFFADPLAAIREEINAQVAPLNTFVKNVQTNTQYETFKSQMKRDPRFSLLNQLEVESTLDSLVKDEPVFEPSKVVTAYFTAIGMVGSAGKLETPKSTTTEPPPAPESKVVTPPHMKPSAPPARSAPVNAGAKHRELTENERKLARLYGMSEAEYIKEMGGDDAPVTDEMTLETFPKKGGK